jgi:hypothetical protein
VHCGIGSILCFLEVVAVQFNARTSVYVSASKAGRHHKSIVSSCHL